MAMDSPLIYLVLTILGLEILMWMIYIKIHFRQSINRPFPQALILASTLAIPFLSMEEDKANELSTNSILHQ